MAKFTIWGFEQYLKPQNLSLFDHIHDNELPSNISKSELINTFMLRANEFELLYSDPLFMREAVRNWFYKNKWTINKWAAALALEYDPITNYDRTEESTDTDAGTVKNTGTQSDSATTSNTGTQTVKNTGTQTDKNTGTSTNTETQNLTQNVDNKVSAYDSDTMRDDTKSSTTNTGTDTNQRTDDLTSQRTDDLTSQRTDALTSSGSNTRTDDLTETTNMTHTHRLRSYGNIGVTTSQQMLQSEFEVARFNILDAIADLFVSEFCILIY